MNSFFDKWKKASEPVKVLATIHDEYANFPVIDFEQSHILLTRSTENLKLYKEVDSAGIRRFVMEVEETIRTFKNREYQLRLKAGKIIGRKRLKKRLFDRLRRR